MIKKVDSYFDFHKNYNKQRYEIFLKRKSGQKLNSIGKEYGLSPERIRQIVVKASEVFYDYQKKQYKKFGL